MIQNTIDGFTRWYLDVVTRLRVESEGATAVEYGLMVALIAAVIIGTVSAIGTGTKSGFTTVCTAMNGATGVGCTP